jgi:hypothetical protein
MSRARMMSKLLDNTGEISPSFLDLSGYYNRTESDTKLDLKVDDSQLLTDVPTGAVFTDTETTTALSINANVLKYTDEAGANTNIDLSLYLDDTNLAYISSGTVASNGIATFTRSDSTTFTVDMSTLLDDTQLSDTDIAAFGYIKTDTQLSDTDIAAFGYIKTDSHVTKTSNYTALPGDFIYVDTLTTGAFTITLPSAPAVDTHLTILDIKGNLASANVTLGRNGQTIMGLSEDMTISTNNIRVGVIFTGTDWRTYE